jgi:replicative DNA helicase
MTDLAVPDSDERAIAPLPRDTRAEMCVLGAMMGAAGLADVDAIAELLTAEDFYEPKHGAIFAAITRLATGSLKRPAVRPEPGLVVHELGDDLARIGGPGYLVDCMQAPESFMSGSHYAGVVVGLARRRRIELAGVQIQQLARRPGEIDEITEQAQQVTYEATTNVRDRAVIESVGDLIDGTIDEIEDIAAGRVQPGIPTGLSDLDQLTGGLKPGQLWIPAGRTSMGKSVITQNWLVHAAHASQRPVILFSLEMSTREMMFRLICQQARVPLHYLNDGRIDDEDRRRMRAAKEFIYGLPLYMVDNVYTTPGIRAYCRRFQQVHGDLAVIGVDFLQELQTPPGARAKDRHLELGDQARDLKHLAKAEGITAVAPCQLNRGPETRGGSGKDKNRPMLSDLRESGNLEQTADVAVLIYRPAYYDKTSARAGEADLIVAKNRNGRTDTVTVADQMHLMRFVDMPTVAGRAALEPPEPGPWD